MWVRVLSLPLGVIILLAVGGLAPAQDVTPPEGAPTMEEPPEAQPPLEGVTEGEAVEGEVRTAPPYEEEYPEDLRERYFRITRDFIKPSLLGLGSVGRVPAWPRGILKAGPFRFTPYVTGSVGWESNVFLREDDPDFIDGFNRRVKGPKKSSSVWEIRTGLLGDAAFMGDKLSIRTALEFLYRDYTASGVDGDWQGVAGLSGRYEFPGGVWTELGISYTRLFDPIDEPEISTRMKRDNIDVFWDIGLDKLFQRLVGGRFKLEIGFDFRHRNFADSAFSLGDREEVEGHIRLSYNFLRDLDAYVEYAHGETFKDTKRLNDGAYDELSFGLDGEYALTKSGRLLGTAFIGVKQDRFDSAHKFRVDSDRPRTDSHDSPTTVTGGVQVRYLMGPRTTFTLLLVRDTAFSLQDNYQTVDRADLSATYMIVRGLIGRVAGYYEWDQPTRAGDVYRYGGGAGLRYAINDFMDADLSYDYEVRVDTDPNGNDYDNHRVELGITLYLR